MLQSCGSKKNPTAALHSDKESHVLLVSFDGMGHDYAERFELQNFQKMATEGASTSYMIPSFPSKSFPNHYSIITGMYTGNHGLVDNNFLDKQRNSYYSAYNTIIKDPYYYKGTPLWQWLQTQGMKTASLHWIGSESPIKGQYPTYFTQYDEQMPNDKRIDKIIEWLSLPAKDRPQFVSAYFSIIDDEGHLTGANSPQMRKANKEADRLLGVLLEKVKTLNIPVNVIVVSDHGILDMDSSKDIFVDLENITTKLEDKAVIINNGMQTHLYFNNPLEIEASVKMLKENLPSQIKVYRKRDIPSRWHYKQSDRIGDVLLVADAPYYMITNKNHPVTKNPEIWGTHGYDPYTTPEMRASFYAVGPNIKVGYTVEPFENVNVFPLITRLLGVGNPLDIDGKDSVLAPIVK
ncbi:MAG: ectonucleotide pyrophosphatase/phosphodiesterase [Capnocytophaga sp.]|nr:ectonucleotide pyrophosphatase/phosphodiesterase [Capnocytophaga sp.]